jgi:hypothetical protein
LEKKITQKCAIFDGFVINFVRHSTTISPSLHFDPPIFDREIVNPKYGLKRVTWKPIPNNSLLCRAAFFQLPYLMGKLSLI